MKDQLKQEIQFLTHDTSYDIDQAHHKERMRLIEYKKQELREMEGGEL